MSRAWGVIEALMAVAVFVAMAVGPKPCAVSNPPEWWTPWAGGMAFFVLSAPIWRAVFAALDRSEE